MERKKYYERDERSYEEKADICKKSDDRCCHCGKLKYINYGATIDHFIPISKGGCDRFFNCIMLCEDCNHEKDDKVVSLEYVPYLKDKYKQELKQYLEDYIHTMDYIERNRLLALDEYPILVESRKLNYTKKKGQQKSIYTKYMLKRAKISDLKRLTEFFIKYLKKMNELDSEEAARDNLIFWLTFGSIYYYEHNNEISMMTVLTIKHVSENESFKSLSNIPQMYIFSYYASDNAVTLVANILHMFASQIMKEQKLDFLPYTLLLLKTDKMVNYIKYYLVQQLKATSDNVMVDGQISGFYESHLYVGEDYGDIDSDAELTESDIKVKEFLDKFDNVTDNLVSFFTKYFDRISIGWMIYDLMSYEYIKDTPLFEILFDENGRLKQVD